MGSRLFTGRVMHARHQGPTYRFSYPIFSLLLDLDEIDALDRRHWWFARNRFALLSHHDRDHGRRDGSPLRPWLEQLGDRVGVDCSGARVHLLAMPRLLGFTFNPLSVYFCCGADGRPTAAFLEVKNTFGEQHVYILHEGGRPMSWPVRGEKPKRFHVSPFIDMRQSYAFHLDYRASAIAIRIVESGPDGKLLTATQCGQLRSLATGAVVRALLRTPLVTFKVIAMIHWQALKLYLRRARFFRKPAAAHGESS